jgi:hypothetical protein
MSQASSTNLGAPPASGPDFYTKPLPATGRIGSPASVLEVESSTSVLPTHPVRKCPLAALLGAALGRAARAKKDERGNLAPFINAAPLTIIDQQEERVLARDRLNGLDAGQQQSSKQLSQ